MFLFKCSLFPYLKITTEINYRFNIRFLYTTLYAAFSTEDETLGKFNNHSSLSQYTSVQHFLVNYNFLYCRLEQGDQSHFWYSLLLPQFVAGKTFTSSMLDTLLYQAYQKPYIVQLFRQLLGCSQVEGSGFIWKVLTKFLLPLMSEFCYSIH